MLHKNKTKEINPDKLAECGRCKNEFYKANMRQCPHPLVQELCGEWICYHCCMRCDYVERTKDVAGVKCGYR